MSQAGVRITAQITLSAPTLVLAHTIFSRTSHKTKAPNHSLNYIFWRVRRLVLKSRLSQHLSWTLGVFVQYPLVQLKPVSIWPAAAASSFPTDRFRVCQLTSSLIMDLTASSVIPKLYRYLWNNSSQSSLGFHLFPERNHAAGWRF